MTKQTPEEKESSIIFSHTVNGKDVLQTPDSWEKEFDAQFVNKTDTLTRWGRKIKNRFIRQCHHRVVPPFSAIKRVCHEHRAVRCNPHVIRAVQVFAGKIRDEHGYSFVRRDGPQLIVFVRAGDEISLRIKHHAIRVPGRLEKRGKFSVRAPFQDAVVRLIHKK